MPSQRYRLQNELQSKVDELSVTLDGALTSHLEQELLLAEQRAASIVAPFERLVRETHATQLERQAQLVACREQLDALATELGALSAQLELELQPPNK